MKKILLKGVTNVVGVIIFIVVFIFLALVIFLLVRGGAGDISKMWADAKNSWNDAMCFIGVSKCGADEKTDGSTGEDSKNMTIKNLKCETSSAKKLYCSFNFPSEKDIVSYKWCATRLIDDNIDPKSTKCSEGKTPDLVLSAGKYVVSLEVITNDSKIYSGSTTIEVE
jgi:hypothetical protein